MFFPMVLLAQVPTRDKQKEHQIRSMEQGIPPTSVGK